MKVDTYGRKASSIMLINLKFVSLKGAQMLLVYFSVEYLQEKAKTEDAHDI